MPKRNRRCFQADCFVETVACAVKTCIDNCWLKTARSLSCIYLVVNELGKHIPSCFAKLLYFISSVSGHRRLGATTTARLEGDILFMSWCSATSDRNFIKYLQNIVQMYVENWLNSSRTKWTKSSDRLLKSCDTAVELLSSNVRKSTSLVIIILWRQTHW